MSVISFTLREENLAAISRRTGKTIEELERMMEEDRIRGIYRVFEFTVPN